MYLERDLSGMSSLTSTSFERGVRGELWPKSAERNHRLGTR